MTLAAFNQLTPTEADALIRPAADIDRWVEAVVSARPYSNVEEVLSAARERALDWTDEDIDAALAHHPRIGDRPSGSSTEAGMSRGEQAGVDAGDAALAAELHAGNRAYEERFGRVFLIRAAGRGGREILDELNRRLDNTDEDEIREVAEQLREIALLRLEGILRA
ncbi:OHCU decarboxylase [Microbacterium barkeri]|uniref:2-oxo-4-hydroxy-4-carboxy-5-ureidoimidazoline decarboxylase n=1 Tax=Microbacterium barkeri TaxID=33917 RepID=A0A9W6H4R9_9MICO|nr:2-oxo-4-hydroxy-4-carboxy-5-ureidoimidazoline decarboxylase [Microbacterium barkeri]MDR6876815.1 2-oxo-4-hydroxy-4-carboxy-5-ureidoimidazoline decarboxylase [Microbacterium barkeri]GLJ62257.1 OHCU decarboxylase [Microbacterium barkeri]